MPTTRSRCSHSARVGQRGEAAHRIAGKAGRDRRVGAIPQQSQRDVHADLGATAGEQRALAAEVGAGVALGVAHGRAVRAELVVEGVDDRVRLLADVAGARLDERAGGRCGRARRDRDAAGLVVDAVGGAGRGGRDHGLVGLGDLGALGEARLLLDRLEHLRRRLAHGHEVGIVLLEVRELGENLEGRLKLSGVDLFRRHKEFYLAAGSTSRAMSPPPDLAASSSRPPWVRAMLSTIARPSPTPSLLFVRPSGPR